MRSGNSDNTEPSPKSVYIELRYQSVVARITCCQGDIRYMLRKKGVYVHDQQCIGVV
jgi:hypothetical protein